MIADGFQWKWPNNIKSNVASPTNPRGKILLSDIEMASLLVLLWLVIVGVCGNLCKKRIRLFGDNIPTVSWVERLTSKKSIVLENFKHYIINHLLSMILGGQCFVFLFHQGTEQPHPGNLNTRDAIPNTAEEVRYQIRLEPKGAAMFSFGRLGGGGEH
jgi:hypothetical protein